MAEKTESKPTPQYRQIQDASNAIVSALATLERDDQLRALDSAVSVLGLKKRPQQPQRTGNNK